MEQIDSMSWRRFVVLYRNLSPYGATASRVTEAQKELDEEPGADVDEERAENFFASVLSTSRGA